MVSYRQLVTAVGGGPFDTTFEKFYSWLPGTRTFYLRGDMGVKGLCMWKR